jgi:hypothetical protein
MIELYSPRNEPELAIIKSILDGEGIDYFVRNEHFGSMQVGPRIELYNAKAILVSEEHYDRARELVSDFLNVTEEEGGSAPRYSLFDKARMVFEMLLFGWIMPGRRNRQKAGEKSESDF